VSVIVLVPSELFFTLRAFTSEVDTGSRKANASKQKARAWFRFNQNRSGSRLAKRKLSAAKQIS
jgi:hypothetical protein